MSSSLTSPTSSDDFSVLGISLAGLKRFIYDYGGEEKFKGKTTKEICDNFIIPNTINQAYCTQLQTQQSPYVKNATIFVSHAWNYEFLNVINAIIDWTNNQNGKQAIDTFIASLSPSTTTLSTTRLPLL